MALKLRFLESERPGLSQAWVCLGDHSVARDGTVLVSPSCAGSAELDCWIDQLKSELEEIRKQGKEKFTALMKEK